MKIIDECYNVLEKSGGVGIIAFKDADDNTATVGTQMKIEEAYWLLATAIFDVANRANIPLRPVLNAISRAAYMIERHKNQVEYVNGGD